MICGLGFVKYASALSSLNETLMRNCGMSLVNVSWLRAGELVGCIFLMGYSGRVTFPAWGLRSFHEFEIDWPVFGEGLETVTLNGR